jgi:hypothetical protein
MAAAFLVRLDLLLVKRYPSSGPNGRRYGAHYTNLAGRNNPTCSVEIITWGIGDDISLDYSKKKKGIMFSLDQQGQSVKHKERTKRPS